VEGNRAWETLSPRWRRHHHEVPRAAVETPVSISFTAAESGEVAGWDAAVELVLDGSLRI
jgi:hypothetical protein